MATLMILSFVYNFSVCFLCTIGVVNIYLSTKTTEKCFNKQGFIGLMCLSIAAGLNGGL